MGHYGKCRACEMAINIVKHERTLCAELACVIFRAGIYCRFSCFLWRR